MTRRRAAGPSLFDALEAPPAADAPEPAPEPAPAAPGVPRLHCHAKLVLSNLRRRGPRTADDLWAGDEYVRQRLVGDRGELNVRLAELRATGRVQRNDAELWTISTTEDSQDVN